MHASQSVKQAYYVQNKSDQITLAQPITTAGFTFVSPAKGKHVCQDMKL